MEKQNRLSLAAMKITAFFLIFLTLVVPVSAQNNSAKEGAPEFLGLRLGMTLRQVMQKYKLEEIESPESGFLARRVKREADTLELLFSKNLLYKVKAIYQQTNQWNDIDDFAGAVALTFKLPRNAWNYQAADAAKLAQLRNQLPRLQTEFTDDAPEIKNIKAEIKTLESELRTRIIKTLEYRLEIELISAENSQFIPILTFQKI